jgi:hypothetical protein
MEATKEKTMTTMMKAWRKKSEYLNRQDRRIRRRQRTCACQRGPNPRRRPANRPSCTFSTASVNTAHAHTRVHAELGRSECVERVCVGVHKEVVGGAKEEVLEPFLLLGQLDGKGLE